MPSCNIFIIYLCQTGQKKSHFPAWYRFSGRSAASGREHISFFLSTSRACSVSLRDVNFAPNFEIRKFRGSKLQRYIRRAALRIASPVASSAVFCQTLLALAQPQALRVRHTIVARDRLARRPHGPKTFQVLEKKKKRMSTSRFLGSIILGITSCRAV